MMRILLSHGFACQAVWARNPYAITIARGAFARAHRIAPADVVVAVECPLEVVETVPTPEELAIVNAA